MPTPGIRSGLDRRSLRMAGLVGMGHAVVVLWVRSALSIIATPLLDPYVVWAFIGLTLVGTYVTYAFQVHRFVTPALGVGVFLGWSIYRQWQYAAAYEGLAWVGFEPLSFYITLWPLPLLIGITLTVLEWGGRKLRTRRTPPAE